MISKPDFIEKLGFSDDPFAQTNADIESRLTEYFVPPPYFADVFGDPFYPQSFFVFAPRGGGKSAQRVMIEKKCRENNVLALTYDNFDVLNVRTVEEVRLEDHIRSILSIGYVGILVSLNEEPNRIRSLSNSDKTKLASQIKAYVEHLTPTELRSTLNSLRSLSGRAADFLGSHGFSLSLDAKAISEQFLNVRLGVKVVAAARAQGRFEPKFELELLVSFAKKIGYRSIFVLIDKVDESALTGNSAIDSFRLIEPMARSLTILETVGIGFKFFLWDAIESHFRNISRPDRVSYRILTWDRETLSELLRKRLKAFSEDRIWKLDSISDKVHNYDVDELTVVFANSSPRDLIRICADIVTEQEQIDSSRSHLSAQAISKGIDAFCNMRVEELFEPKYLKPFRQIGTQSNQVDFTISYIATNVLKESQDSTRPRIKKWKDDGVIVELDRIPSRSGNKVKLFGVRDIRLARIMANQLTTSQFFEKKVRKCPGCGRYIIRDWNEDDSSCICHWCGYDWETKEVSPDFRIPIADDSRQKDFFGLLDES